MAYTSAPPPAVYDPQWFRLELSKIREALFSPVPFEHLEPQHTAPDKPRDGMIVLADGADWNPGSGAGYYGYYGGSWVYLSGVAHGGCQFRYVSATQCGLFPKNGNGLNIDGRQYRIPAAGLLLSNSGLAANNAYYVFAKDNGAGAAVLEAIGTGTTTHSMHTNGVEIRTGDPTRTLVGMVRPNASGQFEWSATYRGVASWFHREQAALRDVGSATTASTSYAKLTNGFGTLAWANGIVDLDLDGVAAPQGGTTGGYLVIAANGTAITAGYGYTLTTAGAQVPTGANRPHVVNADGWVTYAPYGLTGSAAVPVLFAQELNAVVWL